MITLILDAIMFIFGGILALVFFLHSIRFFYKFFGFKKPD